MRSSGLGLVVSQYLLMCVLLWLLLGQLRSLYYLQKGLESVQMQFPQPGQGPSEPELKLKGPVLFGLLVLLLFVGTFGVWAALAPLESAAIAPGIVNVSSKRKTIQHLEGGIISEIKVSEGSTVKAGDVLITLDTTRAFADLEITSNRLAGEYARASRLVAERDTLDAIQWVDELDGAGEASFVSKIKSAQVNVFEARKQSLDGQMGILNRRIKQFREEQHGIRHQIESQRQQRDLLEEELTSMQRLFNKGFTGKTRLLELQRQVVEVDGSLSQSNSTISRIEQSVSEAQLQISDLEATRLNEVLEQLRESQAGVRELTERVAALTDVMERTNLVAPIDGVIVDLKVFTRGGVIAPGAPLMDIVPDQGELIIEARVDPVDIDVVYPGLKAKVRFVSFNQRATQPSNATVVNVSADHFTDERTGASYFLALVSLTEDSINELQQAITPGMPAEVLIVTGEKTPFEYFITPIGRSFERAFRES